MESGRVSIKDIARAAGVSHSTVSRALGPSTQVQADTRARIRVLAEEMGYTPDARAQSLVRGRTQTVGVVVTTISDPFVVEVVQGIETTVRTGLLGHPRQFGRATGTQVGRSGDASSRSRRGGCRDRDLVRGGARSMRIVWRKRRAAAGRRACQWCC